MILDDSVPTQLSSVARKAVQRDSPGDRARDSRDRAEQAKHGTAAAVRTDLTGVRAKGPGPPRVAPSASVLSLLQNAELVQYSNPERHILIRSSNGVPSPTLDPGSIQGGATARTSHTGTLHS